MSCSCEYSYICGECSARYAAANAEDYANEIRTWTIECLKVIAEKLGVELPHPPRERG